MPEHDPVGGHENNLTESPEKKQMLERKKR